MTVTTSTREKDLDPDILKFVQKMGEGYATNMTGPITNLTDRRALAEKVRTPFRTGGPVMASTENITVNDDFGVRIHIPNSGAGNGTLIYIHGGGWTIFSLDTHDRLMREYAERARCAVVGIDYALSPENRYPKALNQVLDCHEWLLANGEAHGLNVAKIAYGGDSAGGNLSLGAAMKARDEGRPMPHALLLNYAALGNEPLPSWERFNGDPYTLEAPEMIDFWRNYLGPEMEGDAYAFPLKGDVSGLPPAHLCIAECDILVDENKLLWQRLKAAGVAVDGEIYKGATHSFLEAVSMSSLSDRALQRASDWLRLSFA